MWQLKEGSLTAEINANKTLSAGFTLEDGARTFQVLPAMIGQVNNFTGAEPHLAILPHVKRWIQEMEGRDKLSDAAATVDLAKVLAIKNEDLIPPPPPVPTPEEIAAAEAKAAFLVALRQARVDIVKATLPQKLLDDLTAHPEWEIFL